MTDTVQVPREATEEMLQAMDVANATYIAAPKGYWPAVYRAMLAAAPQATDPRDAEIERLTRERDEAAANWLEVRGFCRNHGTMRMRAEYSLAAAEDRIATLTAERDAAREGNEAINESYSALLKVWSDVTAERDAALAALTVARKYVAVAEYSPNALHEYRPEARCFLSEIDALTTQPSKMETRDDG